MDPRGSYLSIINALAEVPTSMTDLQDHSTENYTIELTKII